MATTVRFTLDEYDRMIDQGVFDETRDRRIELIHGELREMCPPGPAHEDLRFSSLTLTVSSLFGGAQPD